MHSQKKTMKQNGRYLNIEDCSRIKETSQTAIPVAEEQCMEIQCIYC